MVLLAKNIRGWRALSQLTSESYRSASTEALHRRRAARPLRRGPDHLDVVPVGLHPARDPARRRRGRQAPRREADALGRRGLVLRGPAARLRRPARAQPGAVAALGPVRAPVRRRARRPRARRHVDRDPARLGQDAHARVDGHRPDQGGRGGREVRPHRRRHRLHRLGRADARRLRRYHPLLDRRVVEEAVANTGWVVNRIVPWSLDRSPKLPLVKGSAHEDDQELRRRVYAGLERLGHDKDSATSTASRRSSRSSCASASPRATS
jgi:hypothetical protein